jgi:hypothetical protein
LPLRVLDVDGLEQKTQQDIGVNCDHG